MLNLSLRKCLLAGAVTLALAPAAEAHRLTVASVDPRADRMAERWGYAFDGQVLDDGSVVEFTLHWWDCAQRHATRRHAHRVDCLLVIGGALNAPDGSMRDFDCRETGIWKFRTRGRGIRFAGSYDFDCSVKQT